MKFIHQFSAKLVAVLLMLVTAVPAFAQTSQTGLATYYADKYHGRPTASGELYDKYKFTAAHRTLQFGTMVKVTRLDNGRSVVVKVNDRGPFSEGRIIDVSRAAAEQLDLIRTGETQVKIEVVQGQAAGPAAGGGTVASQPARPSTSYNEDNRDLSNLPLRNFGGQPVSEQGAVVVGNSEASPASVPVPNQIMVDAEKYTPAFFQFVAFKRDIDGYAIQVGAFTSFYRLMEAMDQLSAKGIQNTLLHSSIKNDQPVFRILLGPYTTRNDAKAVLRTLAADGVEGIVVNTSDLR